METMDSTKATLWLPPPNSTIASDVDSLFYFLVYASTVTFILVIALMAIFVSRYRRKGKETLTSGIDHNTKLEILWTVIPTILICIVFFWGFSGFMKMHIIPANSFEIKVTGAKWFWTFSYPEGVSMVNEMVVPQGRPVKMLMSSQDVLHSFFIPDFRVKMDVLPNRYTTLWFEATELGTSNLFCTEYCGRGHSEMIGKVKVVPEEEFVRWIDSIANAGMNLPPAEYGKELYTSKACVTCHSIDGTVLQGPSFVGFWGTQVPLAGGSTVLMDENYVRESILNPKAKIHDGFQPVMPTFQGILKERQVDALIAYIKSLNEPGT